MLEEKARDRVECALAALVYVLVGARSATNKKGGCQAMLHDDDRCCCCARSCQLARFDQPDASLGNFSKTKSSTVGSKVGTGTPRQYYLLYSTGVSLY
jgi:hypothetical protein